MITACLFNTPTPDATDRGEKVSVKTADEILMAASAEGKLRCCECLEPVSPVHRGDRLNHFRHHPRTKESPYCSLRSEGWSITTQEFGRVESILPKVPSRIVIETRRRERSLKGLTQELEQARQTNVRLTEELEHVLKLIAHLTEEAHQAEEIIRHVEDGLKKAA